MTIEERILDTSDHVPFAYLEGQKVKPVKNVTDDGQTDERWIEEPSIVIKRYRTMLSHENGYRLKHPSGWVDDFKEYELDMRYRKKEHTK